MRKTYLLQIAGFNILVSFSNPDLIEQKLMIVDFEINYGNFISYKKLEPEFLLEVKKSSEAKNFVLKDYSINKITLFHKHITEGIERQFVILNKIRLEIAFRNVLQELLKNFGFFLHCSANLVNKKVIIFVADKGGGKSTTSKLIHNTYPSLTDDLGIIRCSNGKFYYYQTPFLDKDGLPKKTRTEYDISAICFLNKSTKFSFTYSKNKFNNINSLIKQIWTTDGNMKNIMKLVFILTRETDMFYQLDNNLSKKNLIKAIENLP
jgi:hypothetical protein